MRTLPLLLAAVAGMAQADCKTSLPLSGVLDIPTRSLEERGCEPAPKALNAYLQRAEEDRSVLTVALQSSPWHFFDGQYRILGVDELAQIVRAQLTPDVKRVQLIASWTGVSPRPGQASLAARLATALDGIAVDGADGFLWIDRDGRQRTTRQAFSAWKSYGPYGVAKDAEVLMPMLAGWPVSLESMAPESMKPPLRRQAAAGWEIFMLCPDNALPRYEDAAAQGDVIAAYNAALLRLERGTPEDRTQARDWLKRAAEQGDEKASQRLQQLDASEVAPGKADPPPPASTTDGSRP